MWGEQEKRKEFEEKNLSIDVAFLLLHLHLVIMTQVISTNKSSPDVLAKICPIIGCTKNVCGQS